MSVMNTDPMAHSMPKAKSCRAEGERGSVSANAASARQAAYNMRALISSSATTHLRDLLEVRGPRNAALDRGAHAGAQCHGTHKLKDGSDLQAGRYARVGGVNKWLRQQTRSGLVGSQKAVEMAAQSSCCMLLLTMTHCHMVTDLDPTPARGGGEGA